MKQQIILQVMTYMLKSLTGAEFKLVMDKILDSLEGGGNKNQKTWHIMVRTMLNVPDNDERVMIN